MPKDDFWHVTPYIARVLMRARLRALEHERRNAWLTAALIRVALYKPADFPAVEAVLGGGDPVAVEQTPEQIRQNLIFALAKAGV